MGLGGFFLVLANPFGFKTPKPFLNLANSPSPTETLPPGVAKAPTPTLILPSGKQSFHVQGGANDYSKVTAIVVDPLDAKKGQIQTLDITLSSIEPVSSFTIDLNSDNGTHSFTSTLQSGDATNGTWHASYTFPDSADKTYNFVFHMTTSTNKVTNFDFPVR